jgi:ribosome biogenesis GTPase
MPSGPASSSGSADVDDAIIVAPALGALAAFGWSAELAVALAPHAALGREPARVVAEDRGSYQVVGAAGELRAVASGRFRHEAVNDASAFPAVGDWVAIEAGSSGETIIHAILPRRSALMRQASGKRTEAQVVGANLDVVFVVASLNADLNVRRLERYVTAAWESGAEPVVLLSKADLGGDVDGVLLAVGRVAAGAKVVIVSSFDGRGVDEVRAQIEAGRTVAFVGSSGVGKSTLLNRLAGEERALVREIREDDGRGRHTTTRRQLHLLPEGGLVLDTPGMRELSLWDGDGLDQSFTDVDEIVALCRFGNCSHNGEPGCAIAAAMADGSLAIDRHESWRKLKRETAHHARRVDALAREEERRKWKAISKSVGKRMEMKYGREGR